MPTVRVPVPPQHAIRGHARAAVLTPSERRRIAAAGGVARKKSMTPERRKAIAAKAAAARWAK